MQRVLGLISFGLSVVVWAGETIRRLVGKGHEVGDPFYVRVSGQDGPTVVITGGIHGNEPAGARPRSKSDTGPSPADGWWLFRRPTSRDTGREPFTANRRHAVISTAIPKDQDGSRGAWRKGKALWGLLATKILMIDLHEGYDFHQINSKSVGSSIIDAKGKAADAVPKMLAAECHHWIRKRSRACVIQETAVGPRGT